MKCDTLLSTSAFKFNLRRYHMGHFLTKLAKEAKSWDVTAADAAAAAAAALSTAIVHKVWRCRPTPG
jgi:hypothetical protein